MLIIYLLLMIDLSVEQAGDSADKHHLHPLDPISVNYLEKDRRCFDHHELSHNDEYHHFFWCWGVCAKLSKWVSACYGSLSRSLGKNGAMMEYKVYEHGIYSTKGVENSDDWFRGGTTWITYQPYGGRIVRTNIQLQVLHYLACNFTVTSPVRSVDIYDATEIKLKKLHSYTSYIITMTPTRYRPSISILSTNVSAPFQGLEYTLHVDCTTERCIVETLTTCESFNGPATTLSIDIVQINGSTRNMKKAMTPQSLDVNEQNAIKLEFPMPTNMFMPCEIYEAYPIMKNSYLTNDRFEPVHIKYIDGIEVPEAYMAAEDSNSHMIYWKSPCKSDIIVNYLIYIIGPGIKREIKERLINLEEIRCHPKLLTAEFCFNTTVSHDYRLGVVVEGYRNDEIVKTYRGNSPLIVNVAYSPPSVQVLKRTKSQLWINVEPVQDKNMGKICYINMTDDSKQSTAYMKQDCDEGSFNLFKVDNLLPDTIFSTLIWCEDHDKTKKVLGVIPSSMILNLTLSTKTLLFGQIQKRQGIERRNNKLYLQLSSIEDIQDDSTNSRYIILMQRPALEETYESLYKTFKEARVNMSNQERECTDDALIIDTLSQDYLEYIYIIDDKALYVDNNQCYLNKSEEGYFVVVAYESHLYGDEQYRFEIISSQKIFESTCTSSSMATVGASVAVILVICLLILFIAQYCRKSRRHDARVLYSRTNCDVNLTDVSRAYLLRSTSIDTCASRAVSRENSNPLQQRRESEERENYSSTLTLAVRLSTDNYEHFLNSYIGSKELKKNFLSIPMTSDKSIKISKINSSKNHSSKAVPYDHNRVILKKKTKSDDSDYVNASYIKSSYLNKHYIAAQGPQDNLPSLHAFLQMIMNEDICVIIMLGDFGQVNKNIIGQYFPEYYPSNKKILKIEDYEIDTIDQVHHKNFTVSKIQIKINNFKRIVTHYHYNDWTETTLPSDSKHVAEMIEMFLQNFNFGTALVHGYTGIGRTGTILLIILLMEEVALDHDPAPTTVLEKLRQCRQNMVQTVEQFNFAMEVLDDLLHTTNTCYTKEEFVSCYNNVLNSLEEQHSKIKSAKTEVKLEMETDNIYNIIEEKEMLQINVNDTGKICVTDYPEKVELEGFWADVLKNKYPSIYVVRNITTKGFSFIDEFIPELCDCAVKVTIISDDVLSSSLQSYDVNVQNDKETVGTVVYILKLSQITDETLGLLSLTRLITQEIFLHPHTPPLCVSTNMEICGLMAAAVLICGCIDQHDKVNVYRTALKLKRKHEKLFDSQVHYAILHSMIKSYIESGNEISFNPRNSTNLD